MKAKTKQINTNNYPTLNTFINYVYCRRDHNQNKAEELWKTIKWKQILSDNFNKKDTKFWIDYLEYVKNQITWKNQLQDFLKELVCTG